MRKTCPECGAFLPRKRPELATQERVTKRKTENLEKHNKYMEAFNLYDKGSSLEDISEKLGVSKYSVRIWVSKGRYIKGGAGT